jgi:thioesterase domain-containing protein
MSPEAFTEYLHRNIPLTAAMQLRVVRGGDDAVELAAPLAPNRNHRDTAFGGSLATLGIVAGWALLQQALHRESVEATIVVQKSECEFLAPAAAEFFAESRWPAEQWTRFLDTLLRRGRARITVHGTLRSTGHEVARYSGTFVALRGEPT